MWVCQRWNPITGLMELAGDSDLPRDAWGHEFMEYMVENGLIVCADDYDTEGDSDHIAVMGKSETFGDFQWEWLDD